MQYTNGNVGTGAFKMRSSEYHQNEASGGNHFSNILDESGDDEEALQNIMVHLEEKQKKREQAKYGEDFANIKGRLTELLEDYQDPEDEEFDLSKLTDPDFFMSKETREKNLAQSEINKMLDEYLEVCHDRTDLLSNVYDSLNFEEIVRNLKSPVADNLDNVSSEISMTIDMIQQSSSKLGKLYDRLMNLCKERPSNQDGESTAQLQLRRLDLQKQVINKFKTLHGQNAKRKEKVDTWKYAANEIVDLLKSARNEGANDFDKLEKEFEKLVGAFSQQTHLFEEQQETISKQKASLKKSEAMKEKLKGDNMLLQDEYDRTRILVKNLQMKSAKLEFELKTSNEKAAQLNETIAKITQVDDNSQEEPPSTLETASRQFEASKLQNEIDRLEDLLKNEQQKNKELTIEKRRLSRRCNTRVSDIDMPDNGIVSTTSMMAATSLTNSMNSIDGSFSSVSTQGIRRKCIKCKSYKTRIDDLMLDLEAKREQIVHLSNNLEEQHSMTSTRKESLKEIAERYLNEGEKLVPPNPTSSPINASSVSPVSCDLIEDRVSSRNDRGGSVIRTSTQQILVYQQVTMEKEEITPPITVFDQSTQTDFPVDMPVVVKQRASVPTQNVIGKNFSSLVDEEFKGMASRIYNYVNTIGEVAEPEESTDEESTDEQNKNVLPGNKSSDDHLTPSSSTVSNINAMEGDSHALSVIPESADFENSLGSNQDDGDALSNSQSNEQQQNKTDLSGDTIKRRGNESGFFDESAPKASGDEHQQNNNVGPSKWQSVKSGVINHVLRFINTTAKCRCSFLDKAVTDFEPTNQNQTDEEIIKSELNIFAEHAIDMLDIISYSVKQMSESQKVLLGVKNFPLLTVHDDSWKPPKRVPPKSSRNVTFTDPKGFPNNDKKDTMLPEIIKKPVNNPTTKSKTKTDSTEVKTKVAEKKRVKVLERHKKLVAKLRQSGVGLKEIYTILGIQSR